MTKTKTPLLSFGATGSIADTLTLQKRGTGTLIRRKPTPTYRRTLPQTYQRWLYQHYVAWWHTLPAATKQLWERNARPYHMTGFAYWMKDRLTNLPDIAGAWHFDERSGSTAIDFSRNLNHGTITGASHVPAFIDYGLSLDGLDDRVNFGNGASLRPSHITIMGFFQFTTIDKWNHIVEATGDWNQLNGYRLSLINTNKLRWRIRGTDNNLHLVISDGTYQVGVQYHIAATYDEQNLIIFIDGQEVKRQPESNPIQYIEADFYIGFPFNLPECVAATMDELIVLNRALTQPEIQIHADRRYPL